MRRLVLIALLATPVSLASQIAPDPPGIYGYVLAPDGAPVSGGTVAYVSFTETTTTAIDRNGRFRIPVERTGLLRVTVSVTGFAPYLFRITAPTFKVLRLPPIHLKPATYFRIRLVTPAGEPITSPEIHRRTFDGSGAPAPDAAAASLEVDAEGAIRIGPLPQGIAALAIDSPIFAQTRVPNVSVTGAEPLIDGGTIVVQRGSTLNVDLRDASDMPVPNQLVMLEDVLPMSPLQFPVLRTNADGRVTFDRLAAGQYRVRTAALGRCWTQDLSLARAVMMPATGTINMRVAVAGQATFRISSTTGPSKGVVVTARPDNPPSPSPVIVMGRGVPSQVAQALTTSRCRGTTDGDGRVTLTSFPPGPSDVAVHFANSLYVRRVNVPIGGSEVAVSIPDGLLPLRAMNAVTHEPVPQAFVTWTIEGGGRSEATATIVGEALLEGVGTRPGILTVTAAKFQPAEERLPEPPGIIHDVELTPLPDLSVRVRVATPSGDALPDAVVDVTPQNPLWTRQLAVTDAKGIVTFPDVPAGPLRVTAIANGYAATTVRIAQENRAAILLTLSPERALQSSQRPEQLTDVTSQPPLRLTMPAWTEPPPKRIGVFTLVPPEHRGEMVQVSMPVGDLAMRAARAVGQTQHRRAEENARKEVAQALRDFQATQR